MASTSQLQNHLEKTIEFHVAIPKDMEWLLSSGEFQIKFKTPNLLIAIDNAVDGGDFIILHCIVKIPTDLLIAGVAYQYKYTPDGKKAIYDELFSKEGQQQGYRCLHVPEVFLNFNVNYHQFDDILHLPGLSTNPTEATISNLFTFYLYYSSSLESYRINQMIIFLNVFQGFFNSECYTKNLNKKRWTKLDDGIYFKIIYDHLVRVLDPSTNKKNKRIAIDGITTLALLGYLPTVNMDFEQITELLSYLQNVKLYVFEANGFINLSREDTERFLQHGLGLLLQKTFRLSHEFFKCDTDELDSSSGKYFSWIHLLVLLDSQGIFMQADDDEHRPSKQLMDVLMPNLKILKEELRCSETLQHTVTTYMYPCHILDAFKSNLFEHNELLQSILKFLRENEAPIREIVHIEQAFEYFKGRRKRERDLEKRYAVIETCVQIICVSSQRFHNAINMQEYLQRIVDATIVYIDFTEKKAHAKKKRLSLNRPEIMVETFDEINRALWVQQIPCVVEEITFKLKISDLIFQLLTSCIGSHHSVSTTLVDLQERLTIILRRKINEIVTGSSESFYKVLTEADLSPFVEPVQDVLRKQLTLFMKSKNEEILEKGWLKGMLHSKWVVNNISHFMKSEFEEATIDEILSSNLFSQLMLLLSNKELKTSSSLKTIQKLQKRLETLMSKLQRSKLLIETVENLAAKEEKLFDLARALAISTIFSASLRSCLNEKLEEVRSFRNVQLSLRYFCGICHVLEDFGIRVDYSDITAIAKKQVTVINEIPTDFNVEHNNLLHNVDVMRSHNIFSSLLFVTILQRHCETVKNEGFSLKYSSSDVYKAIILPAILKLRDCIDHVLALRVSLGSLMEMFIDNIESKLIISFMNAVAKNYEGLQIRNAPILPSDVVDTFHSTEKLVREITLLQSACNLMNYTKEQIKEAARRVTFIFQVKRCLKVTNLVLDIIKGLELTGDYEQIQKINKKVYYQVPLENNSQSVGVKVQVRTLPQINLSEVNTDFLGEIEQYNVLTTEEIGILEVILKSIPFILWLRLLKGPNEVKVFADILMISADQQGYDETDRIANFEASCMAFAPIIFDVKKNAKYEDLVLALRKVSQAARTDKDIITKFSTCAKDLDWFKEAKEREESIAYKSFAEAEIANREGVYIIGCQQKDQFLTEEATVEKVVFLQVPDEHNTGKKLISLEDVMDLQTNLTLIASDSAKLFGDEKQLEKDYFIQKSDMAQRIGTAVYTLCEAGDPSVLNYKAELICNVETWGVSRTDANTNFDERLLEMFEQQLTLWRGYVADCRRTYPVLNYFTMKQCLCLQKYFSTFATNENSSNFITSIVQLPPEVFVLMQTICSSSNQIDFTTVFKCIPQDGYIQLDVLGKGLQQISTNQLSKSSKALLSGCTKSVKTFLNKDRPTLLVLPEDEILVAVLDVYLSQSKRLPLHHEVLLCNNDVNLEQIQLLMQRAISDPDQLYSLVFLTHTLDYQLCQKIIIHLRDITNSNSGGVALANLLIFAGNEHTGSFYITSMLESCRSNMIQSYSAEEISNFLKEHLTIRESQINVAVSSRGGMGKTTFIKKSLQRMIDMIDIESPRTISIHGLALDIEEIIGYLTNQDTVSNNRSMKLYHFDVSSTVSTNLDYFVFHLVVFGCFQKRNGRMWRLQQGDVCYIEVTKLTGAKSNIGVLIPLLPCKQFLSPHEMKILLNDTISQTEKQQVLSEISADYRTNPAIQRVYHYLQCFANDRSSQEYYTRHYQEKDTQKIFSILLKYCGVSNPSWSEIGNFVNFFNQQLLDSEQSIYTSAVMSNSLRGFKKFVVTFLLEMAKDFSTPSIDEEEVGSDNLLIELKRQWESSYHPYLFFNDDKQTITFFGFNVNQDGHLVHETTKKVIRKDIMTPQLYQDLTLQIGKDFAGLSSNYGNLTRNQKVTILCRVLGVTKHDPDPTYELTIDNMKKLLAIHTRLRCGIPVILMGETGCGKTRLINYFAQLQNKVNVPALHKRFYPASIVVKVHGGVGARDIKRRLDEALAIAMSRKGNRTMLFFDEANTTDAIDVIKEIMVDKRIYGEDLELEKCGLCVIAACNPYKRKKELQKTSTSKIRHTEKMLEKLEAAGLGYHVGRDRTYEKIGGIPLRQLVYRVHPLPESMKSLVWDFGQLDENTEQMYTKQIIERNIKASQTYRNVILSVLCAAQTFMRSLEVIQLAVLLENICDVLQEKGTLQDVDVKNQDESSFVSLRDVERATNVLEWFRDKINLFDTADILEYTPWTTTHQNKLSKTEQHCLVLALGVCYVSRLDKTYEKDFITTVVGTRHAYEFQSIFSSYQQLFLREILLGENIARNKALCENVFMMTICIELRIPLFIIGKPGSSKSLAKKIVYDNMHGVRSKSKLFTHFKQVHMTSYQCSPLSTAESIIKTFKQCSRYQVKKDLNKFTSVVVLDEVGLAEDSSLMPLKALHSLLEDGTDGSEELLIHPAELKSKKVAFIGISNWSLDPAKMNRGIVLYRHEPGLEELIDTARGIFVNSLMEEDELKRILTALASAYMELYEQQKSNARLIEYKKEEFFGLRDFYCLIKMLNCLIRKRGSFHMDDLEMAVKRNFNGLDMLHPFDVFRKYVMKDNSMIKDNSMLDQVMTFFKVNKDEQKSAVNLEKQSTSTLELIRANLTKTCPCFLTRVGESGQANDYKPRCSDVRYLLLMTEEYTALPIIEEMLKGEEDVEILFGSSFPKDQQFTQVCRNVNRVKLCMETGKTVVLLNMDSLYESLYDALNQYYVHLYDRRYVDLGLGTQRVKCSVHEDFKLIVVADKDKVFKDFPIPLINRLEKHYVVTTSCIDKDTKQGLRTLSKIRRLQEWAKDFAQVQSPGKIAFKESDAFITFHDDTCASIVIHLQQKGVNDTDEMFKLGKEILLKMATPDAIARLSKSKLSNEAASIWDIYFNNQKHSSLGRYLKSLVNEPQQKIYSYLQITTFSHLLSEDEVESFSLKKQASIKMMSLMQFQTEQSFRDTLRDYLVSSDDKRSILIIQCNYESLASDLVTCTKYICQEMVAKLWTKKSHLHVVFLLQLRHTRLKVKSFSGALSIWSRLHLDELRESSSSSPSLIKYADRSISSLFDVKQIKDSKHYKIILHLMRKSLQSIIAVCVENIPAKIALLQQLFCLETTYKQFEKDSSDVAFLKETLQIIHEDLVDKEKYIPMEHRSRWIQKEAVEQKHQPAYGTFQQALVLCIEEKISPVLSTIIARLDLNNNLLLMKASSDMYSKLWMSFLSNTVMWKTITPTDDTNKRFTACFPFSSSIIVSLRKIMNADISAGDDADRIKSVTNICASQPFASNITQLSNSAIRDYALDLVRTEFDLRNDLSVKIFHEDLLTASTLQHSGENTITIPALHVSLEKFKTRFHFAERIIQQHTDACDQLKKYWNTTKNKEMMSDVLSLHALLNQRFNAQISLHDVRDWIGEVKMAKSLVESMLSFAVANLQQLYGPDARKILTKTRSLWTKVRILQLFLDNLFMSPNNDNKPNDEKIFTQVLEAIKKCLSLLQDDMISNESWEYLEDFIKRTNQHIAKVVTSSQRRNQFQENIMYFFMEVVTEYCFSQEHFKRVDQVVFDHILNYVFKPSRKVTKSFSPFEDYSIDASPVVRSFLLQQLFKREAISSEYLSGCFNYNVSLARTKEETWEVYKLFVHCYEDYVATDSSKDEKPNESKFIKKINVNLKKMIEFFQTSASITKLTVGHLAHISLTRYILTNVVSVLCQYFLEQLDLDKSGKKAFDTMLTLLKELVSLTKNLYAHMYLLRLIIKGYGERLLDDICRDKRLTWLALANEDFSQEKSTSQDVDVKNQLDLAKPDKYIVYGEDYQKIRKDINIVLSSSTFKDNFNFEVDKGSEKEFYIKLAIMRNYLVKPENFQRTSVAEIKPYYNMLTRYKITDQSIMELIINMLVVLQSAQPNTILQMYCTLINNPENLKSSYLPTMPSDDFSEVKKALHGKTYMCPNNHPYNVTECGKPMVEYNCPICKERIGGTHHTLLSTNKEVAHRDSTQPGYILGNAKDRSNGVSSERKLSPVSVSMQRLLIHICMLLGCKTSKQGILSLIEGSQRIVDLEKYLVDHIRVDFQLLSKLLAKSLEETNVIAHLFIKCLLNFTKTPTTQYVLTTKTNRDLYETEFDTKVVQPFIKAMPHILEAANKQLEFDRSIASQPLMRKMYGFDPVAAPALTDIKLTDCEPMWDYRQSLSLTTFKNVLYEKKAISTKQQFQLLSRVLEQEFIFTKFFKLPYLIELQNILLAEFNRSLTTEEIETMKIRDFLQKYPKVNTKRVDWLLRKLFNVWKEVSPLLKNHGRLRPDSSFHPSVIDYDSSIGYILCNSKGQGRCIMSLLDYLAYNHNEFQLSCENTYYLRQRERRVSIMKITKNDIIQYHPDVDLLPLVYSRCKYSLEIGKSATMEYDIAAIEKQLLESMYFGKVKIQLDYVEFICSDDVRRSKKFLKLGDVIPQKMLSAEEQNKIVQEIPSISNLSDAIQALEIVMEVLTSTNGDPQHSYKDYVENVLRMKPEQYVPSVKMQTIATFSHLTCLWTMLIIEKAKRLHANGQEAFSDMDSAFRDRFEEDEVQDAKSYFQTTDTNFLLSLVTQYIVSELPDDTEVYADFELIDALDKLGPHGFDIPDFVQLRCIEHFWQLLVEYNEKQSIAGL